MFSGSRRQPVPGEPLFPATLSTGRSLDQKIAARNAQALETLRYLFCEKDNLFSRSAIFCGNELHRERNSPKRTAIALLGLNHFEESGGTVPFNLRSIQDAILMDTRWVRSLGDLGLLTWFTAQCEPDRLGSLLREFDFDCALAKYPEGREARTSEVALFLAGISHARLAGSRKLPDLTDIAVDAYHSLLENQGEGGIFGQATLPRWYPWAFRCRFGTFGDQISAIYALSIFAKAFQIEEPLAPALHCAHSIIALQGGNGEWWFLYDKNCDHVVNRYPVFSRHQEGIAPVGLLALSEVSGRSFFEPLCKGLVWGSGVCESQAEIEQAQHQNLIWDSIRPRKKSTKYWEAAFSLARISRKPKNETLCIHYKARPDHFGWLLYAFGSVGLPKQEMSAKAMASG